MDNKVYVLYQTRLYRYTMGKETPELLFEFLPFKREGNISFMDIQSAEVMMGEDSQYLISELFVWEGQLYCFYGLDYYYRKRIFDLSYIQELLGGVVSDYGILGNRFAFDERWEIVAEGNCR